MGQLVTRQLHRLAEQLFVRPGQIDQVGRVDGHGSNVQLDQPAPKRLGLAWGLGPAAPGRWVVAEYLQRRSSDLVGSLDGSDQAEAHGQVRARASSAG
jgi:hypothetical protein